MSCRSLLDIEYLHSSHGSSFFRLLGLISIPCWILPLRHTPPPSSQWFSTHSTYSAVFCGGSHLLFLFPKPFDALPHPPKARYPYVRRCSQLSRGIGALGIAAELPMERCCIRKPEGWQVANTNKEEFGSNQNKEP